MPYELLVGWRYLYFKRRSPLLWIIFFGGALLCGIGIVLFWFLSTAKTLSALMMLAGGLSMAAAALLAFFSTFTAISIMGIAIGVSILIWVLSVTSGFQEEFRKKVLGVNAHILILKYGMDFSEYRKVMQTVEKLPEVAAAAPFVFNEMMIAKGPRLSGILVKGVDPLRVGRVLDLPEQIEASPPAHPPSLSALLSISSNGQGKSLPHMPGIIIGRELASKLDAKVGDQLRLISPLSSQDISLWSAGGEMPRSRDFRVTAIFFSGFNEYDKRLVYIHMHEAQTFLEQGDVVTGVDLKIHNVYRARVLARKILAQLGGSPYRTIDWSELNHNLFTALSIQKLFLQIVIGFIVVVAAFNVLAALAMLVIRKTREIAILKSMGMPFAGVARIFQSAGIIVWFIGTGLGLLWGYLGDVVLRHYEFPLDPKVYHISELPVQINSSEFLLTALFALLVCFLATLYPAIRAARMNPVEGLRYE